MNVNDHAPPTTLVFIPGSLCDEALFAPQLEHFKHQYSVVIADISHGQTIAELADAVLHQSPEKFVLLGFSMGGVIAFEIMRRAAHRVEKLILLDTSPLGDDEDKRQQRLAQIQQVKQLGDTGAFQFCQHQLLPSYFAESTDAAIVQLVLDMAKRADNSVFENHWLALNSRISSAESLADIQCPTLILYGQQDQLCPPDRQQLMANHIANSTLVAIANAGHFSNLEQAQQVNQAISHWLHGEEQ